MPKLMNNLHLEEGLSHSPSLNEHDRQPKDLPIKTDSTSSRNEISH